MAPVFFVRSGMSAFHGARPYGIATHAGLSLHERSDLFVVAVFHDGFLVPGRLSRPGEQWRYFPWPPELRAAADCAREAKLPAGVFPPWLRAVADWMREAAAGVIERLEGVEPDFRVIAFTIGSSRCEVATGEAYEIDREASSAQVVGKSEKMPEPGG